MCSYYVNRKMLVKLQRPAFYINGVSLKKVNKLSNTEKYRGDYRKTQGNN